MDRVFTLPFLSLSYDKREIRKKKKKVKCNITLLFSFQDWWVKRTIARNVLKTCQFHCLTNTFINRVSNYKLGELWKVPHHFKRTWKSHFIHWWVTSAHQHWTSTRKTDIFILHNIVSSFQEWCGTLRLLNLSKGKKGMHVFWDSGCTHSCICVWISCMNYSCM